MKIKKLLVLEAVLSFLIKKACNGGEDRKSKMREKDNFTVLTNPPKCLNLHFDRNKNILDA